MGTMVRHALCDECSSGCRSAQPVRPLAIAMVQPAFNALLMSPPSSAALLESTSTPTDQTAVTLSPITVSADEEEGAAICSSAKSLPQNRLRPGCHRRDVRPLDSQRSMMATYTSLTMRWLPRQRGHQRKTPVDLNNRGFYSRLASHTIKNGCLRKPPPAMMHVRLRR